MKCRPTFFIAILLILQLHTSEAQVYHWGTVNSVNSKFEIPYVIGNDDVASYIYWKVDDDIVLERHSLSDGVRLYQQILSYPSFIKNETEFESYVLLDNRILFLYSVFDNKTDLQAFYLFAVDKETGQMVGPEIKIFEFHESKRKSKGNFYTFRSKDNSKLVINYYNYDSKRKQYIDTYKLMDTRNLETLMVKEEIYNSEEKDFSSSNYVIDNEGSLYFLKKYKSGASKIVSYDVNSNYETWEESIDLIDLGLDIDSRITRILFNFNEENDLTITGFYSKGGDIHGVLFSKIDTESKEIASAIVSEFDDEFKDQFRSEKDIEKDKNTDIDDIFNRIRIQTKADGGIILIAEYYGKYVIRDQTGSWRGEQETFGDIIAINLSPEGNLIWAQRIPKYQYLFVRSAILHYRGSYGLSWKFPYWMHGHFSYLAAVDEKSLHLYFNDNPMNFAGLNKNNRAKRVKKLKKAIVSHYQIDLESGEVTSKQAANAGVVGLNFRPGNSFQHKQGDIVVTLRQNRNKNRYQVGFLEPN